MGSKEVKWLSICFIIYWHFVSWCILSNINYGEVEVIISAKEEKDSSCSTISDLWPAYQLTTQINWSTLFSLWLSNIIDTSCWVITHSSQFFHSPIILKHSWGIVVPILYKLLLTVYSYQCKVFVMLCYQTACPYIQWDLALRKYENKLAINFIN